MKKIITILIIIAVVAGLVYVYINYIRRPDNLELDSITTQQVEKTLEKDNTTANINNVIDSIDLGDLDKEFEVIDTELQNL